MNELSNKLAFGVRVSNNIYYSNLFWKPQYISDSFPLLYVTIIESFCTKRQIQVRAQ